MIPGLEVKFMGAAELAGDGLVVEGYASRFGVRDQGGDTVLPGAFSAGLKRLADKGGKVRMLWQHDPSAPIGIWDELREDETGLWVRGRLLSEVERAREAAALLAAGAIEGLSIGYRTIRAEGDGKGRRRLAEVELWEVSLVTFPMLPEARVGRKAGDMGEIAALFGEAAVMLRNGG